MTQRRRRAHGARQGATAAVVCAAAIAAGPREAAAQGFTLLTAGRLADWSDAAVGSEEEMYLRMLGVAGITRPTPFTLRPAAPGVLRGALSDTAAHPWRARAGRASGGRARFALLAPGAHLVYNSTAPFSLNDGFAWTGRGVTAAARGGIAARWRAFSVRLEPEVAWAMNQATGIVPNGLAGPQRFADALEPSSIDAPQRFGSRPFATASLGQSTVRVDALGLAAGVSTANQWIGPALADPLILGTNAGGFPRVFVGTGRPIPIGVGTVQVQVQAGRLAQSRYSTVPADSATRILTAAAAVFTIRGVPGLELGGARLFHGHYPDNGNVGPRVRSLVQTFFGNGGDPAGTTPQNQLASLWGRWVFAGAEVWGEFMRNDASVDGRDFWQEPDHNSGWAAGARRVFRRSDGSLTALRFETLNTRVTHLVRLRGQTRPYVHTPIRQGHTYLGQVLGSAAGQGGLATTIGYDRYTARGRWTAEVARRVVQVPVGEGAPSDRWDVLNYARLERLRFGRRQDLVVGATALAQLNRNFRRDAYGVRLDAGWRFGPTPRAAATP